MEYVCVSLRDYIPFLPSYQLQCGRINNIQFRGRDTCLLSYLHCTREWMRGGDTSYYPVEWRLTPIKNYSISQPGGRREEGEGCTWLIQLFSSSIQSLFPAWDESSQRSEREDRDREEGMDGCPILVLQGRRILSLSNLSLISLLSHLRVLLSRSEQNRAKSRERVKKGFGLMTFFTFSMSSFLISFSSVDIFSFTQISTLVLMQKEFNSSIFALCKVVFSLSLLLNKWTHTDETSSSSFFLSLFFTLDSHSFDWHTSVISH